MPFRQAAIAAAYNRCTNRRCSRGRGEYGNGPLLVCQLDSGQCSNNREPKGPTLLCYAAGPRYILRKMGLTGAWFGRVYFVSFIPVFSKILVPTTVHNQID